MAHAAIQKHPRFVTRASVTVQALGLPQQTLSLANLSLGGMFVCTPTPPEPGTPLKIRLETPSIKMEASVRVVHALSVSAARQKKHPPGMGLAFTALEQQSLRTLARLVDGLTLQAQLRAGIPGAPAHSPAPAAPPPATRGTRSEPRMDADGVVMLHLGSAGVDRQALMQNISQGGMFAATLDPPPLGCAVEIRLRTATGQISLPAEVVHHFNPNQAGADMPGGVGLQFTNLTPARRRDLVAVLEGRAALAPAPAPSVQATHVLEQVMVRVRQFFEGVDRADGFAALGLPATAGEQEVRQRALLLQNLFMVPAHASAAQASRIEAAARVLLRVHASVLELVRRAARAPAHEMVRLEDAVTQRESSRAALIEAARHEAKGHLDDAVDALVTAARVDPDNAVLTHRLVELRARRGHVAALEELRAGRELAEHPDMRGEVKRRVKEALDLSAAPAVMAEALRVLMAARLWHEAGRLGAHVCRHHPGMSEAWRAQLCAAQSSGDTAVALHAAQQLQRLCRDDDSMARQCRELGALVSRKR